MEAELFKAVGGWGRWQKITSAVAFYTNIVGAWQSFAMTFLTPNVPFRCIQPNVTDASSPWPGQCSVRLPGSAMSVPCEKWEYDTERYSDTLVNKGKASHQAVPNVLLCVLAISSGLFALWLPETKGRDLPDTLEDGQRLELSNRRI